MAGRDSRVRVRQRVARLPVPYRPAALALLAVLVVLAATSGCERAAGPSTGTSAGPSNGPEGRSRAIQRMLDRRAAALLGRDVDGFLAAADPAAIGCREEQRRLFRNLADVPLGDWQYRLVRTGGFRPAPVGVRRLAAEVRLRYRIEGYDNAPVETLQRLTFTERDGRWYIAAEDQRSPDGTARSRQLWDQGEVAVVRGSRSLVLGVGQDPQRLREIVRTADRAVPAVADAWAGRWARRLVVLVPESLDRMGELLGAPAAGYRGIAAVTTGEAGGAGTAPADRVILNPDAYRALGEFGRRVVLTHETAHVATRAATSAATPLWLSEGFADWVGYRGTGRTAREIAPELSHETAAGQLPRQLPRNEDFGFGGDGRRLAVAYEGGWLACRMIAERWGEDRLAELYRAVGAEEQRTGAADRALREVLGVGLDAFTAEWRAYAMRTLGPAGPAAWGG